MDVTPVIAFVAGLVLAWAALVGLLWLLRPRDVRLAELIRVVPDILRLCRDLLTDGHVPMAVRLAVGGLLVWLISPIDLIPEFIPVIGPLDDIVVAVLVLRYVRRRLGSEELRARWRGTPDGFALLQGVMG